jgi:O-antigen/teichoic acid export membrane protein
MTEELTHSVLVKQNLFGVMQNLVGFCSNFVLAVLLPIIMGAFLFGQFSLVSGFAYLLVGLFDAGFNSTTIRFVSEYSTKKQYSKLKSVLFHLLKFKLALALVFAALLIAFSSDIAKAYALVGDEPAIILGAVLIIFYALVTFLSAVFIGLNKNQYSLIGNSINSVFLIILPVTFFYLKGDLVWVILGVLLSFIFATTYLVIQLASKFKKLFPKKAESIDGREVNSNILNFTAISMSNLLLFWGIILILGLFVTADDVAFFKIALSWFAAVGILIPISTQILFSSVISFKASNDVNMLKRYMDLVLRYSTMVIIPMMVGIFFFGEGLIHLVYGVEFMPAGFVLQIIIFALFFQFVSNLFLSILVAYGRIKHITKVYILNTIFGILVSSLLINYLNLLGAGIAFLLVNIMISASLIVAASKFFAYKLRASVVRPLASSAIMAAVLLYLKPYATTLESALLVVLAVAVFYFVVLYLMGGITRDDLKIIRYVKG